MDKLFEIEKLRCSYDKDYREGESKVVLEIDHLCIPKGKRVFIVGESGIGKSTILETLGLMNNTIVPSKETKVLFYDKKDFVVDLAKLWQYKSEKRLSEFRLKNYSFIFQSTNLMRNFTAFENISFTRMLQGYTKFSCFKRTRKVLADLGLEHVGEERMAQELSGGQQQRLAFARAILPDFTVLFGDEPTGNLDAENAVRVMQVLSEKLEELGDASAIIVSHDMHLAVSFADVIIKIRKEIRPKKHDYDEDVVYGVIDDSCVFVPDVEEGFGWTNGIDTYPDQAFEMYLRKK
ncbi:MAG: ATP-binding cassette domain-containing protein [Bacteroidaceae bacterium]|nr:ATP-binding cassette domain-containing protein [Bacteroidaceae bacterium]